MRFVNDFQDNRLKRYSNTIVKNAAGMGTEDILPMSKDSETVDLNLFIADIESVRCPEITSFPVYKSL